jgi:8-amino-7-oxononanoate synthase
VVRYPRDDWGTLDRLLAPVRTRCRRGLLVVEGIYSMDGCMLEIERALAAKRRHNLLLMVDEAHSFGILGRKGRGIGEQFELTPHDIDIRMGTLSKTLASCGGYIAGEHALIEYLRYLAPGFIFSVGLSPPDTAAALATLDVLEWEPNQPQQLRDRARQFRQLAQRSGLAITGAADLPIGALVIGNSARCMPLSQQLLEHGIHVQPIMHPAIPHSGARLLFFITINHTEAQFRATMPLVVQELERLNKADR